MAKDMWIGDTDGSVAFITLIKMFLLLMIIGLCLEFYKIYVIRNELITSVKLSAQNALELSMKDDYRREHISIIDEDLFVDIFNKLIIEDLKLDLNNHPSKNSLLENELKIDQMIICSGNIGLDQKQDELPYVKILGSTKYRLALVSMIIDKEIDIRFYVETSNKRYNQ